MTSKNGGDWNINVENIYESTKKALEMLDGMTEEEYQIWNDAKMRRIEQETPRGGSGITYENGIQEWDD